MKNTSKEELFESYPVSKAIFTLTVPMVLSSIVSVLYNLADTYFVGILNDSVQTAAVTLVAPAMILFYAITNLFGIGGSSLMSRKLGTKEYDKVKKASATAIYSSLVCSLAISLAALLFTDPILTILGSDDMTREATRGYLFWTVGMGAVPGIMNILFSYILRAEGRSMHAGIGTMSGCLLNIILDPFFILPFGLNMGSSGAGLATFISNCFALGYFLVLLAFLHGKTYVSLNPRNITFRDGIFRNIFVVGFPGVIQNNLNVVSIALFNNLAAAYGTCAVASIGIVNKINQLPTQIIFGFSQGVMPLMAYNFARCNVSRVKETIRKTFAITMLSLLVIVLVFILASSQIVGFFMDDEEVKQIGSVFLKGIALSLEFMCVDFVVVGISQSFGYGIHALVFSFLRKALFEIPFILLFRKTFGLYGLAYSCLAAEVLMSMIALFTLRKLMKKLEGSAILTKTA